MKELNDLHLVSWNKVLPQGERVAVEMVRTDGVTLIRLPDGRLACDSVQDYAYLPGVWPWLPGLMKALVKMGVITQDQASQHEAVCNRADAERKAANAADALARYVKDYGIDAPELRAEIERRRNGRKVR